MKLTSCFFFFFACGVALFSMPPRPASTPSSSDSEQESQGSSPVRKTKRADGYPQEAFDLFRNFPNYPTSGSRDDQLAFIADQLNVKSPFPQDVHVLWKKHFEDMPLFADNEQRESLIVATMLQWSEGSRRKRDKIKISELEVLQRRVAHGAESVQLIRPDFEKIPNFESRLAKLIDTCVVHEQVSSVELQVIYELSDISSYLTVTAS